MKHTKKQQNNAQIAQLFDDFAESLPSQSHLAEKAANEATSSARPKRNRSWIFALATCCVVILIAVCVWPNLFPNAPQQPAPGDISQNSPGSEQPTPGPGSIGPPDSSGSDPIDPQPMPPVPSNPGSDNPPGDKVDQGEQGDSPDSPTLDSEGPEGIPGISLPIAQVYSSEQLGDGVALASASAASYLPISVLKAQPQFTVTYERYYAYYFKSNGKLAYIQAILGVETEQGIVEINMIADNQNYVEESRFEAYYYNFLNSSQQVVINNSAVENGEYVTRAYFNANNFNFYFYAQSNYQNGAEIEEIVEIFSQKWDKTVS